MEQEKRGYYAIIPANVRYDKDLSANAKLLYGEITALCNEKGYCWAKNDYFSQLYNVDKSTISRWIKQLKEKKYVEIKMLYKKDSKEIENRYMQICNGGIGKNANTPIGKKVKDNNTDVNNTINSNIVEIINYLNSKLDSKYRTDNKTTQKHIKARLAEGFTTNDFKTVIDKKYEEWHGTEMQQYLRPETLFGTKFESYLNAPKKQNKSSTHKQHKQSDIDYSEYYDN